MVYVLNKLNKQGFFQVPDCIVDDHIRLASGEQIKVLLYIFRNSGKDLSTAEISKKLKLDTDDVLDAIKYWVLTGVIAEPESENKAENNIETFSAPAPKKFTPSNSFEKNDNTVSESKDEEAYILPSYSEIASRIDESPEIASLFEELQTILGKTISYEGQCVFIKLYDYYGLPADVICTLVGYCVSIGKTGFGYFSKVGKTWSEQEIDTMEKAMEKIQSLSQISKFWTEFCIETGIKNPKPTTSQQTYIESWLNILKMSKEMIVLAYEKAVESTGKLNMKYMDSILKRWGEAGYKTPGDVQFEERNKKDAYKAKAGESTASYDLEKFREKSINQKLKYERKS